MQRVIVTGGASGIGAATVVRFLEDGAQVAALDRNEDLLRASSATHRVVADVTDEVSISNAIDQAANRLRGLDVLVSCAGVTGGGTVAETALDDWERIFAVNVRGVFLAAKAAIPHLREAGGGAIVNVASQVGLVGVASAAAYCASKGAVINLTRAMAIDHTTDGIRVNAVCPGATRTPMNQVHFKDDAEIHQFVSSNQLHQRLVEPSEIAEAIFYLSSPRAMSTIGAIVVVDGGYTAH